MLTLLCHSPKVFNKAASLVKTTGWHLHQQWATHLCTLATCSTHTIVSPFFYPPIFQPKRYLVLSSKAFYVRSNIKDPSLKVLPLLQYLQTRKKNLITTHTSCQLQTTRNVNGLFPSCVPPASISVYLASKDPKKQYFLFASVHYQV